MKIWRYHGNLGHPSPLCYKKINLTNSDLTTWDFEKSVYRLQTCQNLEFWSKMAKKSEFIQIFGVYRLQKIGILIKNGQKSELYRLNLYSSQVWYPPPLNRLRKKYTPRESNDPGSRYFHMKCVILGYKQIWCLIFHT